MINRILDGPDKFFVVILVLLVILIGIFINIIFLERKIKKMEDILKSKQQHES